jgi:sodium/potassium/calcium exchanger 2
MAAGGSAPELFTSLIGTFNGSDVGIGTVVGSAVFNVLFVIGMCALFSKGVLALTWWPLFRDCVWYIIALSLLGSFFANGDGGTIEWHEAFVMLLLYCFYVAFMWKNEAIEKFVKERVSGLNVSPFRSSFVCLMDSSMMLGTCLPTRSCPSAGACRQSSRIRQRKMHRS